MNAKNGGKLRSIGCKMYPKYVLEVGSVKHGRWTRCLNHFTQSSIIKRTLRFAQFLCPPLGARKPGAKHLQTEKTRYFQLFHFWIFHSILLQTPRVYHHTHAEKSDPKLCTKMVVVAKRKSRKRRQSTRCLGVNSIGFALSSLFLLESLMPRNSSWRAD